MGAQAPSQPSRPQGETFYNAHTLLRLSLTLLPAPRLRQAGLRKDDSQG